MKKAIAPRRADRATRGHSAPAGEWWLALLAHRPDIQILLFKSYLFLCQTGERPCSSSYTTLRRA